MENLFLQQIKIKKGDLSYRSVAAQTGVSRSHIANVLNGKYPLTFETCIAFARWAGINDFEALQLAGLLSDREAVK